MPRKTFTAGEVLAAADVNTFLMDQSVMAFTDSTARGSAIGSAVAVEGMLTYLDDTDAFEYWDGTAFQSMGGGGKIAQVVSTTKTDSFSASLASDAMTSITGLTATITPTSATSKIFVIASVCISTSGDGTAITLKRDSTNIFIGDAAGSRKRRSAGMIVSGDTAVFHTVGISHLDSPATTSATTYSFDIGSIFAGATTTVVVNRTGSDSDGTNVPRLASSITLMEVLA